MKTKTALVTGGAGFIGSTLAKALIADGWYVLVIDNLSTGFEHNVPPEVDFMKLDISEKGFVEKLPKRKFDVLFHLAAQSSGEISFENPEYDVKTNAVGTLLLLDWCKKHGVTRHLYASSMSIYGNVKSPVDENAFPRPLSLYGVGKLSSENYIRIYQNMGVNSTSLRLFNVYGPGQNMENLRQGMISIYLAQALKNKFILVKGSPDRFRDFVYIDDVVDAFIVALAKPNTTSKIYNVCSGIRATVKELIAIIQKSLPFEISVEYSGSTPGDQFGIYGDSSRIKKELNWRSKENLDNGIKKMIDWAMNLGL